MAETVHQFDSEARQSLRLIRACSTDDQYVNTVERVTAAIQQAFDEGCAKQATLELQGRDRFIADLKAEQAVEYAKIKSTLATELLRVVEAVRRKPLVGASQFEFRYHGLALNDALAAIRAECVRLKVEVKDVCL